MEVNRDRFGGVASVLSSSYCVAEEEAVDVLASAATTTAGCGVPFRLRFRVRLWDVSNVSHLRHLERAMFCQKRMEGRMVR